MEHTKTVGAASLELSQKNHNSAYAIDYEREMHKDYENEVIKCINAHLKILSGDFFVVVIRKRERILENVYRNYFFARKSCPTPTYDQTVYKYHRKDDVIEFIWVVPDMETCTIFKDQWMDIAPEEKELLGFVLAFSDGTLDNLAKRLNNEE